MKEPQEQGADDEQNDGDRRGHLGRLHRQDHDAVGLFAAGAARRPDVDRPAALGAPDVLPAQDVFDPTLGGLVAPDVEVER